MQRFPREVRKEGLIQTLECFLIFYLRWFGDNSVLCVVSNIRPIFILLEEVVFLFYFN